MQTIVITAIIGGFVTFLFGMLNLKLNRMMKESEKHHEEHVKINIAERELLLALADTTILTAKKVNDRNSVNGELEESIVYLRDKKNNVQDITREVAFGHLEN